MSDTARREENGHGARIGEELADGVALDEPRDGADHDGKSSDDAEAYSQDKARPVLPEPHPRGHVDRRGKDDQPYAHADDYADVQARVPGQRLDNGEGRLEHARGDRGNPQHERHLDVPGHALLRSWLERFRTRNGAAISFVHVFESFPRWVMLSHFPFSSFRPIRASVAWEGSCRIIGPPFVK